MGDSTSMLSLRDKVAIVTGAGSGLGAAIARSFAAAGARIVAGDLKADAAEDVVKGIKAIGGEAVAVQCDVAVSEGFASLTQAAIERFGALDIVVNCAGYTHPLLPVEQLDEAMFDRVFSVNVKSLFWCVKHAAPRLKPGSVVINIASIGAIRPRPNLCWYNASKGAVEVATKALAVEMAGRGVRVCAINPSLADTPMTREMLLGKGETALVEMKKTIPLGRLCSPQDVADTALFLASDHARYLTGTCINVDGGRAI